MEEWSVEKVEKVEVKNIKREDGILTKRIDSAGFLSRQADIFDDTDIHTKAYSMATCSGESNTRSYFTHR